MIPWWQLEFAELLLKRGRVGSITIGELVSASGLSRQTVQRYLKSFEERGWWLGAGLLREGADRGTTTNPNEAG